MSFEIHMGATDIAKFYLVKNDGSYYQLWEVIYGGGATKTVNSLDDYKGVLIRGWSDFAGYNCYTFYIVNKETGKKWGINKTDWKFIKGYTDFGVEKPVDTSAVVYEDKYRVCSPSRTISDKLTAWAYIPDFIKYNGIITVVPSVKSTLNINIINKLEQKQIFYDPDVKLIDYPLYVYSVVPDIKYEIIAKCKETDEYLYNIYDDKSDKLIIELSDKMLSDIKKYTIDLTIVISK